MISNSAVLNDRPLEDPLTYLRRSGVLEYEKGQTIYAYDQPATAIYLVIEGTVRVTRLTPSGRRILVDIYQPDEFFGESALLNVQKPPETAVAGALTRLMSWSVEEVEEIIRHQPMLAVALVQVFVQRSADFLQRIEDFSAENISRRLARSLIRFAERMGTETDKGSVRIAPLTHEMISQYVGTSREMITHWMKEFQRRRYVCYSRQGILIFPEALSAWLKQAA
jgi:CRP/FNR family transcriptional regulator, cyclic AMP receptor protein